MVKIIKKKIAYFILICLTFITAGLSYNVFAATNTWEFDNSGDYTLSNSGSFIFTGSIANLNQTTLIHQGKINATTYDGAYDVVVDGNYAYMTNFLRDSVSIINISNPAAPSLVREIVNNNGTLRLDGASGIVKDGNYLYIASNGSDALQIINVFDPLNPTPAGQLINGTTLNGARGIAKSGNYIFLTCDTYDALQVIDVTNVATPSIYGTYRNAANGNLNGARDIKIVGNNAFIANYDRDSLAIINITSLNSPSFVGELRQTTRLNGAHHVEISGNYAYVSAYLNNSVMVISLNALNNPSESANIVTGGNYSLTNPRDLLIDGNKLFISSYTNDAVNVVDITTPSSPTYVTKIIHNAANPLLDGADGLFKVGNYIYVSSYLSDALEILKFNYDTTSPSIIPNVGFNYGGDNISNLSDTLGATNQGSITYQISKDNGTTWYYWNGSARATTVLGVTNSNSLSVLNSNLFLFNSLSGTGLFKFKAFFTSNGDQKVELDNFTTTSSRPSPGGVSSNLQIWLKANKGTSTTTDGGALATWNDQSGNGFNAGGGVSPTYYSTTNNLNFNPIVDFNGTTQYLENLNNGAYSQNYFAVVIPDSTIDGTQSGQVPFGFDCDSGVLNTGTCGLPFGGLTLGAFTIAINDEVITHAIGSSTGWRSAQIGAASYPAGKPMLVNMNQNALGDGTEISEKGVILDNYNANTYQTLSTADYRIGMSTDPANLFPYNGKIAEIINFSSRISPTDKQKIESYLSLKYGMTLNSGTQNYIASNGTTNMWSISGAGTFVNDIAGIGRDDGSELGQIKSKSVNNDEVVTIEAVGEGTNATPSFVDIADFEFLTIANNNLGNSWAATDTPTGYFSLTRSWKVQETGEVGTLNLDFDVANSNFDIPALSIGTSYYIIYDSNNNGVLSDETPLVMTNTSGSIWRRAGINLNNNQKFTIATQASTNNIPTNITLSNNSINENVVAGTTVGTLSTTDADALDTHTYSFVTGSGDTDNSSFTITTNTLSINRSPDYELKNQYFIRIQTNDGNGGTFQKEFTININNLGEAINSIINFENIAEESKYTVTSGTWTRTTTNPYEGAYSLESSNGGLPNTQSCFEITNTFNATGTVSFYYNVSSQLNGDYLRFYIDNIEQQAWSGTVPWTNYIKNDVAIGTHSYKWCYIKDGATNTGSDNAFIDYSTFNDSVADSIPPVISSINFASGTLLPGGNHNIIINYSDLETGINTISDVIALYKWNGSSWGTDISATGLNLGSKIITATSATYGTNNLIFGKYRYNFQISDNYGNSSSTGAVFYVDEPELNISSGSLDIGDIKSGITKFSSGELVITVKTLGAGFDLILNKISPLLNGSIEITDWNGVTGVGYDKNPYSSIINLINTNEILATQVGSINTNGDKNTYIYSIKMGALVGPEQAAGKYYSSLKFGIDLDY